MSLLQENKYIDSTVVEEREYQLNVCRECKDKNSLVILPTGLGKTIIAGLIAAQKLSEGQVLFMAPTKPLCEQHQESLQSILKDVKVRLITGENLKPSQRKEVWSEDGVYVATPQTVANDIKKNRYNPKNTSLAVFDEAHRAVGDYAYTQVANAYLKTSPDPQTLGLTASPGSDIEKLREVVENLEIDNVSIRGEWSNDVKPYIGEMDFEWREIEKPIEMVLVEEAIDSMQRDFLDKLSRYTKQARNMKPDNLSKKGLIEIQKRFRRQLQDGGQGYHYQALSMVASCIKTAHMKNLLTTQGPESLNNYIEQLEQDTTKAAERIQRRQEYPKIKKATRNIENKKLKKTSEIVQKEIKQGGNRVIVFAEYRSTVDNIVQTLNRENEVDARKFIGQADSHGKTGMTQKQQKERLDKFRENKFNVLVSTRIGEEGIDIPLTSLVVFYEPVPSAVRLIQRKGRTARDGKYGRVIVLIMKNSQDEAYYWKSQRGQKKMYKIAYQLKNELTNQNHREEESQSKLNRFT
ncbi:MAG: DEAD/DEAH box helicase [Methanonatronarchaeia archaeon]|nr:MAG: DEAD/DEAH box helicase [Methanonatronarchaeia archaeon]